MAARPVQSGTGWRAAVALSGCALALTGCSLLRPAEPAPTTSAPADPLVLGTILSAQGWSVPWNENMQIAARQAVTDINDAGGVLDQDVQLAAEPVVGDDAVPDAAAAVKAVQTSGTDGGAVDAVVLGANDADTFAMAPDLASAGILAVSATVSAPDPEDLATGGLLLRMVPDANREAKKIAADAATEGNGTVAVLALDTVEGHGLAEALSGQVPIAGGSIGEPRYLSDDADVAAELDAALKGSPSTIVIEAGEQTAPLLTRLDQLGYGDGRAKILLGPTSTVGYPGQFSSDLMRNVTGFRPGGVDQDQLQNILLNRNTSIRDYGWAAQTYDGIVLTALAAQQTESTDGPTLAKTIPTLLAGGNEGEECGTYAACASLIRAGKPIVYTPYSGTLAFDAKGGGLLSKAAMTTWSYAEDGTLTGAQASDI